MKIDFLLIGAHKCGTNALRHYIEFHPNVISREHAPIHFFDENYTFGASWYLQKFNFVEKIKYRDHKLYELTASYIYHPDCPKRIYEYNPDMKLILLVRDPVKRAFSDWMMHRNYELNNHPVYPHERREFVTAFSESAVCLLDYFDSRTLYFHVGKYSIHIRNYLKYFSFSQILVIEDVELKTQPVLVMDKVSDFLNLKKIDWTLFNYEAQNVNDYHGYVLSEDVYLRLCSFYDLYNRDLCNLLQRSFTWAGEKHEFNTL